MGKFQSGQSLVGGKGRRLGHGHTGPHHNAVPLPFQRHQAAFETENQCIQAVVRRQHIGARAQNQGRDLLCVTERQQLPDLFLAIGKGHGRRRAAQPERHMLRHGFFQTHLHFRTRCLQGGNPFCTHTSLAPLCRSGGAGFLEL